MRPRRPVVLAVLLAAGGLAGCDGVSFGEKVDAEKAQREIAAGIREQTGVDATVVCPGDVKREQGTRFTCTATPKAGGRTTNITVVVQDDQGAIAWAPR